MQRRFTASSVETRASGGLLIAFAEVDTEQAREIMFSIAEQLPGPIWGKIIDEINEE